jgi:helix-turn-helix protein
MKRSLTVEQAAQKFRLHANTVRRFLRQGRLKGKKISGRSGGEWMILEKAEILPPGPKGPAALSYRELKCIYRFSLSLTRNVDEAHIREMIRRGFFSDSISLHELGIVESVAKDVLRRSKWQELDPLLLERAKSIVERGAKVPFQARHAEWYPEYRTYEQRLADSTAEERRQKRIAARVAPGAEEAPKVKNEAISARVTAYHAARRQAKAERIARARAAAHPSPQAQPVLP